MVICNTCLYPIVPIDLPAVTPCKHNTHLLAICVERSGRNPKAQNMNAHVSSVRSLESRRTFMLQNIASDYLRVRNNMI